MNPIEANSNIYNTQIGGIGGYGRVPLSGTTTTAEAFLPSVVYGSSVISDSFPHQKPLINKSDSTLTYNNYENNNPPLTPSRKRSRESCSAPTPFSFLGYDMSFQIQEQQFDIDRLISQHVNKHNNSKFSFFFNFFTFLGSFVRLIISGSFYYLFFLYIDGESEDGD